MNQALNSFLEKRGNPLLDKLESNPDHPEQVLTTREGIELLTIATLKQMVEKGELSISEKGGEFYFKWKGDQNYVNTGSSSN